MKVLIVEDEIDARKVLVYLIKQFFPEFEIIGETGRIDITKKIITQHNPDLVFLDVQLEDGTGIDLLEDCSMLGFYTIITTAYSDFAIDAIKYSVVDYLLKPIIPEEFQKAVKKVIKRKKLEIEIKQLKDTIVQNHEKEEKIIFKTSEGTFLFPVKDIIRMEADGSYTKIVTTERVIIVSKNIKHYQEILPESHFVRTHQSHLVNKLHVLEMTKSGDLLLSNNETIPIAFRKKSYIRGLLKNGA